VGSSLKLELESRGEPSGSMMASHAALVIVQHHLDSRERPEWELMGCCLLRCSMFWPRAASPTSVSHGITTSEVGIYKPNHESGPVVDHQLGKWGTREMYHEISTHGAGLSGLTRPTIHMKS